LIAALWFQAFHPLLSTHSAETGPQPTDTMFSGSETEGNITTQDMNILASEWSEIVRKVFKKLQKMSVSNRKFCFVIWYSYFQTTDPFTG
jgi:hypothetical protein